MRILGIVGSLRNDSLNRKLILAAAATLPADASFELADIGSLPLYNEDLEADFPAAARSLKEKIRAADAVMIATPEFDRTLPAALKNALEWTSRPYGDNAWAGKNVLVMGTSSGAISSALAQYDLKKILLYLDAKLAGQPEIMIPHGGEVFGTSGEIVNEGTKTFLAGALARFAERVRG